MNSKQTFISVVTVLSLILVIGGWSYYKQKNRYDENNLQSLHNDFSRLESLYNAEIGNTQDSGFIYNDPEAVRVELSEVTQEIRKIKQEIAKDPKGVLKAMPAFLDKKHKFTRQLDQITSERNQVTGNFIISAKEQIANYKQDLEKAMKQNTYLRSRLNKALADFKGTKEELEQMKAERSRLDSVFQEQQITRSELDSLIQDRNELRALLAKSQQLIAEQQAEIAALSEEEQQLKNFAATYVYKDREIPLDMEGTHRNHQTKQMTITFDVGTKVFEEGDAQVVYVTLYKDGQPSPRMTKQPITVVNNKAKETFEFDPKLEKGDYFFRVTYKEKPIMSDYQFRLLGLVGGA